MSREYTARETRWIAEYIKKHYAVALQEGKVTYQASLGPLAGSFMSRSAPRADAIIELAHEVIILEAETENVTSAFGQLLYYDFVFPLTAEYKDIKKPRRLLLLLADLPDQTFRAFMSKYDVRIDTWAPDWLVEYVKERAVKR